MRKGTAGTAGVPPHRLPGAVPPAIDDQLLSRCSEFITTRFGLYFPKKRWRDLARTIVALADDFGSADAESFIRWLIAAELTQSQLDILADRLTIGETYFFREPRSFELLETEVLPPLLRARREGERRLRIWSAGCSTGEEAYSIAMLLQRILPDLSRWNVTILATDINPASLKKAARGEYGAWSFRGIPPGLRERFFHRHGEKRYEVTAAVRKMVIFSQLNLAEDPYPSLATNTNAMDIIFCRNVLMYFAPQQVERVIENFRHALVHGGWLVVSPCETSHTLFSRFETVNFRNAILYRKADLGKPSTPLSLFGHAGTEPHPLSRQPVTLETDASPSLPLQPATASIAPPVAPSAVIPEPSPYEGALEFFRQGLYDEAAEKLMSQPAHGENTTGLPFVGESAALLARVFANKGDFAAALEWSEKAVAVAKLDPEIRYLQATILQEQGETEAAVAALKKALYLDHTFVLAHLSLANLSRKMGKKKDAAKHLENAAELLTKYGDDDILPGSDGMSARRLGEIIAATRNGTA